MRCKDIETIFYGRVFNLVNKAVKFPNGKRSTLNIIQHRGASAVVPLFENNDVLLIKQLRPAVNKMIYEIPAGLLEKGESSLRCAKRELLEETGFVARRFSMIGRILTSPGFCTEEISIFLGEGIKKISGFQGDKDEYIKIERIPLGKIVTMIMCGRIKDAKTIVGIFLTRNILKI